MYSQKLSATREERAEKGLQIRQKNCARLACAIHSIDLRNDTELPGSDTGMHPQACAQKTSWLPAPQGPHWASPEELLLATSCACSRPRLCSCRLRSAASMFLIVRLIQGIMRATCKVAVLEQSEKGRRYGQHASIILQPPVRRAFSRPSSSHLYRPQAYRLHICSPKKLCQPARKNKECQRHELRMRASCTASSHTSRQPQRLRRQQQHSPACPSPVALWWSV